MDTSTPVPKGKKTYYPNKVSGKPVTITLTQDSRDEAERCSEAITAATGKECSRADLLEHGWRVVRGLPVNQELVALLRDIKLPELTAAEAAPATA